MVLFTFLNENKPFYKKSIDDGPIPREGENVCIEKTIVGRVQLVLNHLDTNQIEVVCTRPEFGYYNESNTSIN